MQGPRSGVPPTPVYDDLDAPQARSKAEVCVTEIRHHSSMQNAGAWAPPVLHAWASLG